MDWCGEDLRHDLCFNNSKLTPIVWACHYSSVFFLQSEFIFLLPSLFLVEVTILLDLCLDKTLKSCSDFIRFWHISSAYHVKWKWLWMRGLQLIGNGVEGSSEIQAWMKGSLSSMFSGSSRPLKFIFASLFCCCFLFIVLAVYGEEVMFL